MAEFYSVRAVSTHRDQYHCQVCKGALLYTSSSELYHRYECTCGAKLLVPKKEEK